MIIVLISTATVAVNDVHVVDTGETWFTVRFNTSEATNATVYYGTDFHSLEGTVTDSTVTTNHLVNLTGLDSDSLYYYDVSANGNYNNYSNRHYRFITNIGDGKTYFMSNNGSDSNDGSYYTPFKTINHSKYQLNPGDTLLIMDGVYTGKGENVAIDFRDEHSGDLNNPITYRAYNAGYGVHPIFDGEFGDTYGGPSGGSFIFFVFNAKNLVFDHLWGRNIDYLTAGSNTVSGFIVLYRTSNHIDFRDCYLSSLKLYDELTVSGGFMIGGTENITISESRVWDVIGETDANHGGINIFTRSNIGNDRITVNNNEIWDSDAGVVIKSTNQHNVTVTNNFLHDVVDEGIHDIGGNSTLRFNIIVDANQGIESVNNYDSARAPEPIIEHNTIVNCWKGTNFADWHTADNVTIRNFENNILFSDETGEDYEILHDTTYSELGADFLNSDYNIFYHATENNVISYNPIGVYINLSEYQSATGLEQNSQQIDPGFIKISNDDFRLYVGATARTASSAGEYIGAIPPDQVIRRIEIHPLEIDMNQDDEYLFVVKIFNASDNAYPPGHFPVSWSARNGTIDKFGLYNKTEIGSDIITVQVLDKSYDAYVNYEGTIDTANYHAADTDSNGTIESSELRAYIINWKKEMVTISELFHAIEVWKT